MITKTIPGLGDYHFPDDMTDDEIKVVIQNKLLPLLDSAQSSEASTDQALTGAAKYLQDVAQSPASQAVLGAGDQFVNSFKNMANMFVPESMPQLRSEPMQSGQGGAYEAGSVAGDVGAFVAGGGALNAARLGLAGVKGIGKAASALSGEGARGIGRRALGSGLYGASQSEGDRLQGAGEMAAISTAIDSLLKGGSKLLPKNVLRGNLSDEALRKNLETARGTETGLGSVLESPLLKEHQENILANLPFSGVKDQQARIGSDIGKKGENILAKYLGDTERKFATKEMGKDLEQQFEKQQSISKEMYKIPQEMADSLGVRIKTDDLASIVSQNKKTINSESFLSDHPATKKALKQMAGLEKGIAGGGSLKEANIRASELNRIGSDYSNSPLPADRNLGNTLSSLGGALKKDIRESLEKSGNTELINSFNAAEKNYGENLAQYFDPDIYKFARPKTDKGISKKKKADVEDIIPTFLKTGPQTDKGDLLASLTNKLSPKGQDLAKYIYLSRALEGGKLNPSQLPSLLGDKKIGQNQLEALFPKKSERDELANLLGQIKMNPDAMNRMFNPETGRRGLAAIPPGLATLGGIVGGAGGLMSGGGGAQSALLGLGGVGGALAASGLYGRGANKLLTSEKIRESLVRAIIDRSAKSPWAGKITTPMTGSYMRNQREE